MVTGIVSCTVVVFFQEEETNLYECLKDYKPKTSHIQGLPLKKGDIVKVRLSLLSINQYIDESINQSVKKKTSPKRGLTTTY